MWGAPPPRRGPFAAPPVRLPAQVLTGQGEHSGYQRAPTRRRPPVAVADHAGCVIGRGGVDLPLQRRKVQAREAAQATAVAGMTARGQPRAGSTVAGLFLVASWRRSLARGSAAAGAARRRWPGRQRGLGPRWPARVRPADDRIPSWLVPPRDGTHRAAVGRHWPDWRVLSAGWVRPLNTENRSAGVIGWLSRSARSRANSEGSPRVLPYLSGPPVNTTAPIK